ncbi:MAG: hypothetical protein LBO67_02510 [Spirochaetaceae bacterium]|nr:hypothetical protein [Spirochaetaceae bacterium]
MLEMRGLTLHSEPVIQFCLNNTQGLATQKQGRSDLAVKIADLRTEPFQSVEPSHFSLLNRAISAC